MPHTIEKTVFNFDELSDRAKDRAREWFREGNLDYDWRDAVYEDAAQCAAILGIDLRQKPVKLMNGSTRHDPAISFSGFWSQGDGACFEGSWSWCACSKAIRDHAPQDEKLHAIADALTVLPCGEGWRASMKHRDRYCHSGCMSVDVEFEDEFYAQAHGDDEEKTELPLAEFMVGEEVITQTMRDFADWIYRQLEQEYEYLQSDEQVDESIRANEYTFDENGNRDW